MNLLNYKNKPKKTMIEPVHNTIKKHIFLEHVIVTVQSSGISKCLLEPDYLVKTTIYLVSDLVWG